MPKLRRWNEPMKQKSLINQSPLLKRIWHHWELYIFLIPCILNLVIFKYIPMSGLLMAFQDVNIGDAYLQSDWVGLEHFTRFFNSKWLPIILKNTAAISLLCNVLAWPFGLILALLLHNSNSKFLRKTSQNLSYIPHLLSVVIVISILQLFCAGDSGLINILIRRFGGDTINFFADPNWVWPFHVITTVWQGTGYNAVVYLGALAAVDEQQIEAAKIDGASKLQCITKIQLPTILPTVVTVLILNMGQAFNLGADKAILLQNDLNLKQSEVISTYVYKAGIGGAQYGFSTAMDLFQNLINLTSLLLVNFIASKITDTSVL